MAFFDTYAEPYHAAYAALAGLLGLLIGSFLNVIIHRIPKMMARETANFVAHERGEALPHSDRYNVLLPSSTCPACGTRLPPHHNIPLLSYLFLRGRCGECKAPIAHRYPLVELLTGTLFALIAWHFGIGFHGLAAMTLCAFLIALAFIDLETMLLPDDLTLPLLWLGLLVNLGHRFVPLQDAVIGAAAGYAALWLVYWAFRLATGKDGLGYGDFKLLAALGAWLGWQALPFVLLTACMLGAVVGIALVLMKRQDRDHAIPFGPYLAIAGILALLYGSDWLSFGIYDY